MKSRHGIADGVVVLVVVGLLGTWSLARAGDQGLPSSSVSTVTLPGAISGAALSMGVPMEKRMATNGPGEPGVDIHQHDVWVHTFSLLNGIKDELMSQLDGAREQYPELLFTFRLLATYSNFLEVRVRNLSRNQVGAPGEALPPVMDLDCRFRTGLLPPDECPPYEDSTPGGRNALIIGEMRDATMEEKIKEFEEFNKLLSQLMPSCEDIKAERQEKLDRLNELAAHDYLMSEEIEEMYECIERVKTLTDVLLEYGCIRVLYLIDDPYLPVLEGQ